MEMKTLTEENKQLIIGASKFHKTFKQFLLYFTLILFAIATLYSLVWMIYTSFKTNFEISQNTFALPTAFHWENYYSAWHTAKIGLYMYNSVVVTVVSVIFTILISTLAAFILAKFEFPGRKLIYTSFIVGMLIPLQSLLVPLFIQMRKLNLINSQWSLIISYTAFGLPISIFILENFIRGFSDSIIEAAIIDGCTMHQVFSRIALPMCRPAIATVTIINCLNNWKEFSFALTFINDDMKKTLPLGLYNFVGAYTSDYAQLMAALTIASLPLIILYFFMQEQVINGMTAGAVKG